MCTLNERTEWGAKMMVSISCLRNYTRIKWNYARSIQFFSHLHLMRNLILFSTCHLNVLFQFLGCGPLEIKTCSDASFNLNGTCEYANNSVWIQLDWQTLWCITNTFCFHVWWFYLQSPSKTNTKLFAILQIIQKLWAKTYTQKKKLWKFHSKIIFTNETDDSNDKNI